MSQDFVLDASFALSWCFVDETTSATEDSRISLQGENTAYVPELWLREILNTLLVAERRGRIKQVAFGLFLTDLRELPIEIVNDSFTWKNLIAVRDTARKHQLSAYDAEYLLLAKSLRIPLASFDNNLRSAAKKENIELIPTLP